MQFPEPPKASSGVEYTTLEERCQACQVNGGDEGPCIPETEMWLLEANTGFPCPYREPVTPDDGLLLRLVAMSSHPGIAHIWRAAFDVAFDDRHPQQRRHRMEMIMAALSDERVTRQLAVLKAANAAGNEKKEPPKGN